MLSALLTSRPCLSSIKTFKKSITLLTCIAFWCSFSFANNEVINVNTEEFSPLSYSEAGEIKGIATDQVRQIFEIAKIPYDLVIFPWTRAYKNALTSPNTCVYTTTHSPARSTQFKWIEPLYWNKSILITNRGMRLDIQSLEEAKKYRIGVQAEDVAKDFLEKQGFTKLDLAVDIDHSILKLKANRINMVALAESAFDQITKRDYGLVKVMDITALKMGLACNLSVPDSVITRLQRALDQLIDSGKQQSIIDAYHHKY